MKRPKVLHVALDQIDGPDLELRDQIDQQKLRDLADSMARRGLLQPIGLRPTADRFKIIYGNRRFLAAILLHWLTIPARISDGDPAGDLADSLHENLFRENLTPMEEAALVAHLQDTEHMDLPAAARALNHTVEWTESRAALLALPPQVQAAIHTNGLSLTAARLLGQIDDPDYLDTALDAARTQGMTERAAMEWLRQYTVYRDMRAAGTPAPLPTPDLIASEANKIPCDLHGGLVYINVTKIVRVCFDCLQAIHQGLSTT